jgi:hypothetical protein
MTKNRLASFLVGVLAITGLLYYGIAYVVVPAVWAHYEHQPGLAQMEMVTKTKQGIPGDPINVGLVGTREEILAAMKAAGWISADPVNSKTSIKIASSVVLHKAYLHAPVSPLFYNGRVQDLAFEKSAGKDAGRRHHVRFWKVLEEGQEGRPVWLGAATFDKGVGLNHYTGQITHHISGDVDGERNQLIDDLTKSQRLTTLYAVSGIGPSFGSQNGGGDYYYTDGEIQFAVIAPQAAVQAAPPQEVASPALVSYKDMIWAAATGRRGR